MRAAAAILLVSAAIDWPALVLDRAGVALLGLSALSLALTSAARRPRPFAPRPRGPAILEGLDKLEPDLRAEAARLVATVDNGRGPS